MERLFSAERLKRFYAAAYQDEAEAAELYAANIRLSESLYPSLAVAEVVLRNAVHRQLKYLYQTEDWYLLIGDESDGLPEFQPRIDKATEYIVKRREQVSADKIVAELTFGFWVSLFNSSYEDVLWKQLRLTFAHLPKADRQRSTVSVVLNAVRTLRNRVYHNEPICWQLDVLVREYKQIRQLIGWIDPQLLAWLDPLDRFPAVVAAEQHRRKEHRANSSPFTQDAGS